MPIFVGGTEITQIGKITAGGTDVKSVWVGNMKIWPVQVIFDADYIMLKYTYSDGTDLDTRTRIQVPATSDYLGWSRLSVWPNSPDLPILEWGGDNQGAGTLTNTQSEAVLINLTEFKSAYPSNDVIEIDCRAFWFGNNGLNPAMIEATFWKGGTIIRNTPFYQYSNPTALNVTVLDSVGKIITVSTTDYLTNGDPITVFKYTISTSKGEFIIA